MKKFCDRDITIMTGLRRSGMHAVHLWFHREVLKKPIIVFNNSSQFTKNHHHNEREVLYIRENYYNSWQKTKIIVEREGTQFPEGHDIFLAMEDCEWKDYTGIETNYGTVKATYGIIRSFWNNFGSRIAKGGESKGWMPFMRWDDDIVDIWKDYARRALEHPENWLNYDKLFLQGKLGDYVPHNARGSTFDRQRVKGTEMRVMERHLDKRVVWPDKFLNDPEIHSLSMELFGWTYEG